MIEHVDNGECTVKATFIQRKPFSEKDFNSLAFGIEGLSNEERFREVGLISKSQIPISPYFPNFLRN